MVSIIESIILGIIQGLTEWFPVSSSGHLALYQNLFNVDVPVLFDIYLHLGTLLVLFIFFWKEISGIIKDVVGLKWKSPNMLIASYIVMGCVITGALGMLFYDFFSSGFNDLRYVGFGFLFSGIILFVSGKVKKKRDHVNFGDAVTVGFFQGLSLIPGVSRSGATIGSGMLRGADRVKIAKFSFLMSIPAIFGAALIQSLGYFGGAVPFLRENLIAVILGVFFSAFVGYLTLSGLMRIIKKGGFHHFSWYCFVIGIITLILNFSI